MSHSRTSTCLQGFIISTFCCKPTKPIRKDIFLSFLHWPLIQQTFTEHLPCKRHCVWRKIPAHVLYSCRSIRNENLTLLSLLTILLFPYNRKSKCPKMAFWHQLKVGLSPHPQLTALKPYPVLESYPHNRLLTSLWARLLLLLFPLPVHTLLTTVIDHTLLTHPLQDVGHHHAFQGVSWTPRWISCTPFFLTHLHGNSGSLSTKI